MNEIELLGIIKDKLSCNSYLGDDCAFLSDLDIFISHDTLVEDVHFSIYTTSAYLLGRKSVAVNLSDIAASLSCPKYLTVSLSLPSNTKKNFVEEFYRGVNDICNEYNVIVIGGDITGAEKIVISVCAIGKKNSKFLSSRKYAKKGDYVLTTGFHGSSSAGLYALSNFLYADESLINSHLNPIPRIRESSILASSLDSNIAVMDSSDGLIDALYKIALASKHSIEIDINKVPVNEKLIHFSKANNLDYKNFVMWGGEDFELIICVSESVYLNLDHQLFTFIGRVNNKDSSPCVIVKDVDFKEKITNEVFLSMSYNHFAFN